LTVFTDTYSSPAISRADRFVGSLIAAIFIPALIAGVAATHFGLHPTALVYCAAIATLAAVAAASLIFRRRSSAPVRDPAAASGAGRELTVDTAGRQTLGPRHRD
jgi:hypothetical protein